MKPPQGEESLFPTSLSRYTNIGLIKNAAGTIINIAIDNQSTHQSTPSLNDELYLFFFCDGTEKLLELSTYNTPDSAIFDLYINGILDSTGYDNYLAAAAYVQREITLTQKIQPGINIIKLVASSQNGASIDQFVNIKGASLQ